MEYRRVKCVLATSQLIGAYGGIQVDRSVLEDLAAFVRESTKPMTLNHDSRRTFETRNVTSGVRERPDGEWEAWAEYDMPKVVWDEWSKEVADAGAPGGMSFTYLRTEIAAKGPAVDVKAALHADASHYSPEQIRRSTMAVSRQAAETTAGDLLQFGFTPAALTVLDLVGVGILELSPSVAAAWLYDSLRGFLRRERPGAPADQIPRIVIDYRRTPESTQLNAYVQTDDEETLRHAIDGFVGLLSQNGKYEFGPDGWSELLDGSQDASSTD